MGAQAGIAIAAAVLGNVIGSANKPKDMPTPMAPPAPPPSQAAKTPDAQGVLGQMQGTGQAGGGGGTPGVAQTFLTGPGGVDPSKLSLGKSSLLGT